MTRKTLFDLASLTKPLATTTAVMHLVKEGRLRTNDKVAGWIPDFNQEGKDEITLFHLLNHSSGLRAWQPYYRELIRDRRTLIAGWGKKAVLSAVHREKLHYRPGSRSLYSDLGFLLAGEIVEAASGQRLDHFCKKKIFDPLGLQKLRFRKVRSRLPLHKKFAATQRCVWRKRILRGEVDDGNAYVMGGIAGHAGLFGTAKDVFRLTQSLLDSAKGVGGFLPAKIVRTFTTRARTPHSSWALGWDTPSEPSSSGRFFSRRSYGHLGFTGCSLWCDPDRDLIVVLLTNRVHPTSQNVRIRSFRPILHDLVVKELGS